MVGGGTVEGTVREGLFKAALYYLLLSHMTHNSVFATQASSVFLDAIILGGRKKQNRKPKPFTVR